MHEEALKYQDCSSKASNCIKRHPPRDKPKLQRLWMALYCTFCVSQSQPESTMRVQKQMAMQKEQLVAIDVHLL